MDWETACRILEVPPDATDADIKKKFKIWSFLLAPDANSGKPEDVVKAGEKEFIKKIAAKEYLLATGRRQEPPPAGPPGSGRGPAPTVAISPKRIRFRDIGPGEKKRTHIEIKVSGGKCEKIRFNDRPAAWLEVVDQIEKSSRDATIVELILVATASGSKEANCSLPIEIITGGGHKIKESIYIEITSSQEAGVGKGQQPRERPAASPKYEDYPPTPKPLLQVTPRRLTFSDMVPLGTKITSFDVKNVGGPFTNYVIDTSQLPNWLEITGIGRLTEQTLPVRVTLKATGQVIGTRQECELPVGIENKSSGHTDEVKVHIELVMRTTCLHIDRDIIEFQTVAGMECPVQSVAFQNTGFGYVEGTISAREQWIKLSPRKIRFTDQQIIQVQVDTSKISKYDVGTIDIKTNAGDGLIRVKVIIHYPNRQPTPATPNKSVVNSIFLCPKCGQSVRFNRKTDRFECIGHPNLHHWKYLKDFNK